MTLEEYHQLSESMDEKKVVWSPVLDVYQMIDNLDLSHTLLEIKTALNKGDRVPFAVLLLDLDQGMMGAVGKKGISFDSWVLTPEIAKDAKADPEFAGHEMVITGYDDNAVAKDIKGRTYKGLLTLRNSWGSKPGDQGNFYMSYEYFKLLAIEAQRIRRM